MNIERGEYMLAKHLDLRNMLDHIISVSDLGRGQASRVISEVEKNKDQYIVIKNNKPQAVILSIDEYNHLLESKEELELLLIATSRLEEISQEEYTDMSEIMQEFGIDDEELEKIAESVEIE
jgi:prevent-host-death family protein